VRLALALSTLLFLVALAAFSLLALVREGVTLGTLVLVIPSLFFVIVLGVGIGGALKRGPRDR